MPTTSLYRLAKALERLIVVRRDVHAIQTDVGRYCKVDEELTTDTIKQHLEGSKTIGSYIFQDDNFVKWFCFDLDINKNVITEITQNENLSSDEIFNRFKDTLITQAKHIQDRARHYDIHLIPEFSGNKGIHLWAFCDRFIDAGQIRIVMKGILREVDMLSEHFHIDLFPTQDSTDGKLGNFVKLPCGIHKKTGNRCSLLADDYKISEYSYESQLELLFDIAMGDNLVSAEHIKSLQEEFVLDETTVEEHKERLVITEETLADLSTSDSKVERIFSNCDTFSGMIDTAKDTGYLTHAQRLALAFSLNKLGKQGREKLDSILGLCNDYNPEITEKFLKGIKKNGYSPYSCKSLLKSSPHHNESPVCDKGGLCNKVKAINGYTPNSFSFIPKSETALQIELDSGKLKEQKEKLNQTQEIVAESNLHLAWQRVKNSLQNEVWYDVEEVDRYERFLNLNISLLSLKLDHFVGEEITFNPYERINVRKFKESDPEKDSHRPISVMALEDYIIAQAIMNVVSPIFDNEEVFHENSYGNRITEDYKSSPRNIRYWSDQWDKYSSKISQSIVHYPGHQYLKIDLKQYYENIPHDNLITLFSDEAYNIETNVQIWLNSLITNFKYADDDSNRSLGIPQGPEFSHIIANIYLNQFDQWINKKYGNEIIAHYRYVDDIYVLISEDIDSDALKEEVETYLESDLGLQVNKEKSVSGYNFIDGFDMVEDLNKVKYRIGKEIKELVQSEGEPTVEEVKHIENLIKSMIAFESDADVDEILPHLNFASRALFKLGIDTTLIKNTLVEHLNNWNPSTYNLKFLLKLLLDIYSSTPTDDIVDFFKTIDSYRKLLTLELIREINGYQGFDENDSFKQFALNILKDYKDDTHHLVRGTSFVLLAQFENYIDKDEWKSLLINTSTSDFEKRSLVAHLNGYSDAVYPPYFEQYYENTTNAIPSGITTILDLPNDRFTSYSTALSNTLVIIETSNQDWIWKSDNLLSVTYLLFANLRLIGNINLQSKNTSMRVMEHILENVPNAVSVNLSRSLSRHIPDFIQTKHWDSNYYLNLYDPRQLNLFPSTLKNAIHELLISTPAGITEESPDIDKRLALFTQEFNDGIMLELLNRVKAGELQEDGLFPNLKTLQKIITNEDRRFMSFTDATSGNILFHEKFPLENAISRSTLENEQQVKDYFETFINGDGSPVVKVEVSEISERKFISILYEINPDQQLLADSTIITEERDNFNVLQLIESKLNPFTYQRSEGYINLPHIHPYSIVNNVSKTDLSILSIGSMFDQNVYYLSSKSGNGLYSQDFSGSSVYFNMGFLSFELLTGNSPITAWRNAEIRATKNEENKYLSNDDALDKSSYFYRDWWLKTLCNSVVDFRRTYNPSIGSDLLIDKMFKKYEKTLKATEDIYDSTNVVDEKDKSVIDYLAFLDVSAHDLDDAFWKKRYRDVIPSFLNTFTDFISKYNINWKSSECGFPSNEYELNIATCDYIKLADEFENFLNKTHDIYSSRLHDTYFYPSLLYQQAVKNEVYCLLVSLLENAGMDSKDKEQIEEAKRLIFNVTEDNIELDFEESVSFSDSINAKKVASALFTLFGSEKNSFEKFFANDLGTIAGLLYYLNGKAKFVLKVDEDQPVDIFKLSFGIDDGSLKSIVENIFILNEKIHKVRNHPSDVSESEYQKIIKLVKLIFTVSTELNPATISIGNQDGVTNLNDETLKVEVGDVEYDVEMTKIAFPSGKYETIYSGDVGVGIINEKICYINPPSRQVRKALNKIENSVTTEETAIAVIQETDESGLKELLREDYLNLEVRKRMREIMGEDKKIIVQRADQIINVGDNATLNTGSVVQNIQHVNEEREVQAESSEIQNTEVYERPCSHNGRFVVNNQTVKIFVEGDRHPHTIARREDSYLVWNFFNAMSQYSSCEGLREDCSPHELIEPFGKEIVTEVHTQINRIKKRSRVIADLNELGFNITGDDFILPANRDGGRGYRLHEDFCIVDLTEVEEE